ncbi:hypothetical protein [Nitriliruptor alkaliphilus]|uniref:hypothetical protein n=1 Tax=Nitriliruptor alkaliphilus TaxID=427918 RepID=UPI0012ED67B8|nr:hypothetical protein [Nitriliruptor alkaliphilus]
MIGRWRVVIVGLCAAALTAGCGAGPSGGPLEQRPYLVAVDDIDGIPSGTVSGTLVVERECVLLEDDEGLLLPLFASPTAFGPLDGGAITVDVGGVRLRVGDEVTFAGRTGEVTDGVRSRYPGVDLTRCGVRRFALLGDVVG